MDQSANSQLIFDNRNIALVYATPGVTLDFVRNPTAYIDPTVFASRIADLQVIDSPCQLLETSQTQDGTALNLDYLMPLMVNPYEAGPLHVFGVEIAMQLNELNIPASDLSLELLAYDQFDQPIESVNNLVTGNVAIMNGSTRQYIRMIFSEQYSTSNNLGTTARKDGQVVYLPKAGRVSSANITKITDGATLTAAECSAIFSPGERLMGKIRIAIAAGKFTSGVIVTVVPLTIGRVDIASNTILAIENLTSSDSGAFVDRSNILRK